VVQPPAARLNPRLRQSRAVRAATSRISSVNPVSAKPGNPRLPLPGSLVSQGTALLRECRAPHPVTHRSHVHPAALRAHGCHSRPRPRRLRPRGCGGPAPRRNRAIFTDAN
jgi:hypothetical protein